MTATSTFANANSAANIIPVGPPPAITTACSLIAILRWIRLTKHLHFALPLPRVLVCGGRLWGRRGACNKPPMGYKLEVERECFASPCWGWHRVNVSSFGPRTEALSAKALVQVLEAGGDEIPVLSRHACREQRPTVLEFAPEHRPALDELDRG